MRATFCRACLTGVLAVFSVAAATAVDDGALVARFLDYRKLPRLTERKIEVQASTTTLCRDPRSLHGPHLQPGIHLYANDAVTATKHSADAPVRYPVGALLVKEKFEAANAESPSIITVMEKVENSGRIEDWRFYMIRLSDKSIVREGFSVSCVDCHARYPNNDFVSSVTHALLAERTAKKP